MSCVVRLSNLGPEMDWEIKQGTSFTLDVENRLEGDSFTIQNDCGDLIPIGPPLDISGCVIRCQIRKRGIDTGTPVATPTMSIVDGLNGVYRVALTDEQTALIPCGERIKDRASIYVADILCEFPSGEVMELGSVDIYVLRRATK